MKIPVSKAYAKWMEEDAERLNAMAELARKVAVKLPSKEEAEERAFCATGPGGGVKNDCPPGDAGGGSKQALPKSGPGDPKSDQAWLSPSGQFHPVDRKDGHWGWRTHHQWARENGFEGGDKELFGKGWMRVVVIDNTLYGANDLGRQITDKQKKSLKDHALLRGHGEAVYDNGQNVSAFWSKDSRAFCPTGPGGGIDNSCSAVSASDPSLKERVPFKPIGDGKNSDFIRVPSVDELTEALTGSNSSKGTKIGSAKDLPAGTPVALRIDIPAFNYSTKNMGKAIYAVTIHENKGGKSFGSPLAYEPMARLTGPVTFAAKEKEATKVATGEANKFPLATVKGNFDPSRVMPPDIDSWTPVGYDPKKASYFYDKKTGREVMGGTDALSVGNSVFVRIPKYGYRNAKETYRDAGFWGVEYRAFCPTGEGGGVKNDCPPSDGGGESSTDSGSSNSGTATAEKPQSNLFSKDENTQWSPASGREPFPGASRYSDISVSGGKAVASSLDSMGIKPEDAVSLLGAPDRSSVFMRPAPEFGQKFYAFSGTNTPPVFMGFEADVAGIRRGLEGTYVLGSRKNNETGKQDLVLYGNVMDVLPAVSATAERRHAAARAFYKTMTSGIENARKAGVSTVMFSAAGKSADSDRAGSFRGYTIWPRMGFDGPLPKHIVDKLPSDLSHARTLMDLHATREGTKWWAKNGEDIDVELNLADRNSPQNKVFDRFVKHFSRDRRDLPLGEGDGWLSPEDLARLDEMWAEIWDEEDILDDYDGGEQKFVAEERAYCPTGEGNGVDNSCSSSGSGSGATNFGSTTEAWGGSQGTEIWTPERPLFKGAEGIGEIMINRPADVRGIADELGVKINDVLSGSGVAVDAAKRLPISKPRVVVTTEGDRIQVSWRCTGAATGKGYKTESEKEFAPRRGTIVEAVAGARTMFSERGQSVLDQQAYGIHPDFQGNGIALESVLRQVSAPFDRVVMQAARFDHADPSQRLSGYSAWWKYGYDAPIDRVVETLQRRHGSGSRAAEIPAHLTKGSRSLLDIMAKPGGPEWWKEFGGDITLTFDKRPGSQSRVRLLDLKAASDKKRGRRSVDVDDTNDQHLLSSDCEHDPIVEEVIKKTMGKPVKGRPMTDEEWAEENALVQQIEQRRAKDGRPPEVRPH